MPKPIYTFHDECAVNPCKSRSAFHAAKLQLFRKPAKGWAFFLFLPWHQQPCHPCAGLCGGLGSMAAARFYLPSPIVASRHREARSDPFMIDLRKIYFQKSIHFISNHLPDSKRLQTTTVDYKRLFNGLVLTRVASLQRKTTKPHYHGNTRIC